MTVFGLPAHPLAVHAAVVLTPLACLVSILFAMRSGWRYLTRRPAAVLAVLAAASVWAARLTGVSLRDDRFGSLPKTSTVVEAIQRHQSYADILSLLVLAFAVFTLIGTWLLGGPSGFASGAGAKQVESPLAERFIAVVIVVVSLLTLVYVVLTGDAGARAAWGQ